MEIDPNRIDDVTFGMPLHHMSECLLERRPTGLDWVAIQIIEILSGRGALRDEKYHCRVREPERRQKEFLQEFRLLVFGTNKIDRDPFDLRLEVFCRHDHTIRIGLGKPLRS